MLAVNTLRASRCRPYWRYSAHDAVYGLGGNIVRAFDSDPGDTSSAHFIETQLEIVVAWNPARDSRFLSATPSLLQDHLFVTPARRRQFTSSRPGPSSSFKV